MPSTDLHPSTPPVASIQPAASRVSVIIPALNEASVIGDVVRSMPWHQIAECIVVDNGSSDGTGEVAAAAGARVLHCARGYGRACWTGAQAAQPSSDVLVFLDGDGADVLDHFDEIAGPVLRNEEDLVLGSRVRGHREPGSMLPSQIFAAHLVGALLRVFLGVRYTDMGAFRAIRRSSYQALRMSEMTYGWNLEMQIKAVHHRLRILEIPVDYRCRQGGESKVAGNLSASWRAAVRILEVLFRVGIRRPARALAPSAAAPGLRGQTPTKPH